MDLARGHEAMRSMFYPYRTSGQDSAPLKLVWNQGRGVVHHALLWVFVGFLFPFSKLEPERYIHRTLVSEPKSKRVGMEKQTGINRRFISLAL